MGLEVRRVPWSDEDGQRLVAELEADLAVRYAPHADDETEVDEALRDIEPTSVEPPAGAFLLAILDGVPVGCVTARPHVDDAGVAPALPAAELKRMYVAPGARGRGVARALLAALEAEARALGYRSMVLETGTAQPEAIALYESEGWSPVGPFGAYRASPVSRAYGKRLGGGA